MISGSTPFSFAIASICWSSGLVVAMYFLYSNVPVLELDFQPGALDVRERHAVDLAAFFEQHHAMVDPGEPAGKRRLSVDRLGGHHLRQPSLETPVISLVP